MGTPDIVIVGGGVIGAACARALAMRGVTVHLIGEDRPGAATTAAAGMLAPLAESRPDDPLLAFSVRARDLYAELAPALLDETGIDIGLWSDGIYQVAFDEGEVDTLRKEVAWQRQSGFSAEWLSLDELRERLPGIGPDALGAALAPEDGAVEPDKLREALLTAAATYGATVSSGVAVERLVIEDGATVAVRAAGQQYDAGAVLIAAGCWSGRLDGLPRPVSVEPLRGQMMALDWPRGEPPAIVYGAGGYVVARGEEAIAGSTMEHAGYDPSVTEEGLESIRRAASRLYPAFSRSQPRRAWAGLRPGTPDGRPILGADPEIRGLWYATGHGRNGILLAGLSAEVLAQMVRGENVTHEVSPMDPARFWTAERGP